MVLANGLKYACAACIKGHRSSSCTHTDRPLFEIKKKGRPVTQCEHCRQLRKTKQVHVKCSCGADDDGVAVEPRNKAKRKIPTTATFPDGLSGPGSTVSSVPEHLPQRIGLASCSCDLSFGSCACATPVSKKSDRSRASSSGASSSTPATPPPIQSRSSCCGGKSKSAYHSQPQTRSGADFDTHPGVLPDGLAGVTAQAVAPVPSYPGDLHVFSNATLPSMFSWPSGIEACQCGVTCICPGCHEHSDPSSALMSSEPCPYACATCTVCSGFGFAPAPRAPWTPNGSSPPLFQAFDTLSGTYQPSPLPSLASTSTSAPFAPDPLAASPKSSCCGGSCKCSAEILGCDCDAACCGCCFGCSCSEDSDYAEQEDCGVRGSLGFAVSGVRASCCADPKAAGGGEEGGTGGSARKKKRKTPGDGPRSRTGTSR